MRLDGARAALAALEQAVQLDPGALEARAALGTAYAELERFAEAIPHLEYASPKDPALLLPLSRAYKATGRAEDAARTLEQYKRTAQN